MAIGHVFRRNHEVDWRSEFLTVYRPMIGDLDVYPEVNNGRHFVMFDMARYQLAFAIGLVRYTRKHKLAFVVGGSTIRYRKRVRPFRKTLIRTQLVGMDEKFFYFQHTIEQGNVVCSSALVRAGLRSNSGTALPAQVMNDLGFDAQPFMETWAEQWANWDDHRPWPEALEGTRKVQ